MRVSPFIISSLLTYGATPVPVPKPASKPDDLAKKPALSTTPIVSPPSRALSEVSTEFRVNTYTEGIQWSPSITSLGAGGFVVAWSSSGQDGSGYGVYAQRYGATGEKAGGEFRVNTYTESVQENPSITSLADGGFVIVWQSLDQDGSVWGVYAQRYDVAGEKAGDEFKVNTYISGSQEWPSITSLADGGFVVAWESSGQDGSGAGVYAQRYSATGEKAGSEFRVNTYTESSQRYPSITSLADGGFLVAWTSHGQDGSGYGVYAQRYGATGEKAGGEFRVNTYTAGWQWGPSITSLADGGFVVAWESNGQDGSSWGIYAQRYDATGEKVGGEFRVNTYTAGVQYRPSITSLADGGFVVAWTSEDQDGSGYGVYAQRYGATGEKAGGEFRVNTYTVDDQSRPSITSLADGGFVVAWTSDGQDGSEYGVYAQKYDCVGSPVSVTTLSCPSENDIVQPITAFRVNTDLDSIVVVDLAIPDESLGRFTLPAIPAGVTVDTVDGNSRMTGSRAGVNTLLAGITLTPVESRQEIYQIPIEITVYAEGVVETTVSGAINIQVENDAPAVHNPIPQQVIPVNQAWTFTVPDDVFVDVDDPSLSLIAYESTSALLTDGIQFDSGSRTFTWTPTEASTRTIVLKATDSGGISIYHQFELVAGDGVSSTTVATTTAETTASVSSSTSTGYSTSTDGQTETTSRTTDMPSATTAGDTTVEPALSTSTTDVPSTTTAGATTAGDTTAEPASSTQSTVESSTPALSENAVRFENPVSDIEVPIGERFTVQIPSDTFFDPNNNYNTRLFQIISDGSVVALPAGLTYDSFTGRLSGQLDEPVTLRLVLVATDPDRADQVNSNPFSLDSVATTTTTQVTVVTTTTTLAPEAAIVNWAVQAGASIPALALALLNRN